MPAAIYNPEKKSVYLDQSVISQAFNDTKGDRGSAVNYDLYNFINKVSKTSNLCLSLVHLFETLRHPLEEYAYEMAKWIDTLDVVWMKLFDEMLEEEFLYFLLNKANPQAKTKILPFHSSFLQYFTDFYASGESNMALLAEGLKDCTALNFVKELRSSDIDLGKSYSVRSSQALHKNYYFALEQENGDKYAITAKLNSQCIEYYKEQLLLAHEKLIHEKNRNYYIETNGIIKITPDKKWAVDHAEGILLNDSVLPCISLQNKVLTSHKERIKNKTNINSKKFITENSSNFHDWMHLVGGAYCDIFTCDSRTSDEMGDWRCKNKKTHQITMSGGTIYEQLTNAIFA